MNQRLRPTQLYDVAVVGSDPGGLLAGALLAHRGHRVVHLATAPPAGPELLPGWKALPLARAFFDELSLTVAVNRALEETPLQIVSPGERIDLPADGSMPLLAEAQAASEVALPLVEGAPLPAKTWVDSWKLKRLSSRVGALSLPSLETPLGKALKDLHRFTNHLDGRPSALSFAAATAPLLGGIHHLPGGLYEVLRASIRNHRGDTFGDVANPVIVDQLVIQGGGFAGLLLRGGDAPFRARVCLLSQAAGSLVPWLPEKRGVRQQARALNETARLLSRVLVSKEEAIPPGLGPLALCSGWEEGPALLQVEPAPGGRKVTVHGFSKEAIDRALFELLPFHEAHLQQPATGLPGSHLLFENPGGHLGIEGAPLLSAVGRIIHVGSDVLPGLGLEGAFIAGRRAADLAQEICKKVKPLS